MKPAELIKIAAFLPDGWVVKRSGEEVTLSLNGAVVAIRTGNTVKILARSERETINGVLMKARFDRGVKMQQAKLIRALKAREDAEALDAASVAVREWREEQGD